MKRATLSAIPASAPVTAAGDLTDRLLSPEPAQSSGAGGPKPHAPATAAPKAPRARTSAPQSRQGRQEPSAAEPEESDALRQALLAAQHAVDALQVAGRSEPARYEVALRFRLDSLAHHVQQVKDYVAATLAR
jgi:hypothetical protein